MTEPMEALRAVGNLQYLLDSLDDGDADLRALRDGVATQVNSAAAQILHIAVGTLCSEVTIKKVEENSSFATSVCWMLKKLAKTSRTFGPLNDKVARILEVTPLRRQLALLLQQACRTPAGFVARFAARRTTAVAGFELLFY